jgi:O-antigen ligase
MYKINALKENLANSKSIKLQQILICVIPIAVTIYIFNHPGGPYTTSKYHALITGTLVILPVLLVQIYRKYKENRYLLTLVIAFLFVIFSQLVTSKLSDSTLLTGSWGRNTGIISYLCLITLFTYASLFFQNSSPNWLLKSLLISSYIQIFIGYLQFLKLEPFSANFNFRIMGTLGNQNFYCALLGLAGIVMAINLFTTKSDLVSKVIPGIVFIYLLVMIQISNAKQGFYLILVGLFTYSVITSFKSNLSRIRKLYLMLFYSSVTLITFLAIFNEGPLAPVVFDYSMQDRLYMWQTAWRAFLAKPLFGFGFDSHLSFEQQFQSAEAKAFQGNSVHADAAHNVFLDFASYGGVLLLLSFTLILILILVTALKAYRAMNKIDNLWAILFCLWVGLQAENLISINYLPLATWEFVISGALYGYSRQIIRTNPSSSVGGRS